MKLYLIISFVAILTIQACDENETVDPKPEPQTYLTISVDPKYYLNEDIWFFTTDVDGKVLEGYSANAGSTVTFKMISPPEFVNLTEYRHNEGSNIEHVFNTYGAIARGTNLIIKEGTGYTPPTTGSTSLRVENCNPISTFNFSDGIGHMLYAGYNGGTVETPFELHKQQSDILISAHKSEDEPVYGWLENVTPSGAYTVDFNSLLAFPRTVSFPLKGNMTAYIQARKADAYGIGVGYIMANTSFNESTDGPELAKIGYLDGYDHYTLSIHSKKETSTQIHFSYYIKTSSSLPDEVVLEDGNSFSIENVSFDNFDFTYSFNYTVRTVYWSNKLTEHRVDWLVTTNRDETPRITELPKELTSKYPSISMEGLSHYYSGFKKYNNGYTYAKSVEDLLGGNNPTSEESVSDTYYTK